MDRNVQPRLIENTRMIKYQFSLKKDNVAAATDQPCQRFEFMASRLHLQVF